MLLAAGFASARDRALISLLALNGLRVSEATGGDIEALGLEHAGTTLTILRKGGKVVTIPLAPAPLARLTSRSVNAATGPIFLGVNGDRLDRHARREDRAPRARKPGITKRVGPHTLRYAFKIAALDAGVLLRDVQKAASHADPRITMR